MRSDMRFVEWSSFVAPTPAWGCIVVGSKDQLTRFVSAPPEGDLVVRILDGRKCSTQQSLFKETAKALEFPTYFGHNWNAFDECITDMTWLPASSYVVVVTDFASVLPDDDRGFKLLLESLLDAAAAGVRGAGAPPAVGRPGKLTVVSQVNNDEEARLVWKRLLSQRISSPAFYKLPSL